MNLAIFADLASGSERKIGEACANSSRVRYIRFRAKQPWVDLVSHILLSHWQDHRVHNYFYNHDGS